MRLEILDIRDMAIRVAADDFEEWEILRKISSLVMIAYDCSVNAIRFCLPGNITVEHARAIGELAARNQFMRVSREAIEKDDGEFGFVVVCREEGFICLRDAHDRNRYRIFIEAEDRNVDLASRTSYIITSLLGFSTLLSFEARFGIYELLSNIVEHGSEGEQRQWVQISLDRRHDKLYVSMIDRGNAFNPTGGAEFDLAGYVETGKRRGLGLIFARKIAERLHYRREHGYNKVFFEKSTPAMRRERKENEMAQFEIRGPDIFESGTRMFQLVGDLDTKGALVVEDLINQLLEENWLNVVLDFDQVPFVSSAGVGILLGLVSTIRDKGGEIYFARLSPKVKSVFGLLNLDDYFKIIDTVDMPI
jgi:anti-sigma B factor antagonist